MSLYHPPHSASSLCFLCSGFYSLCSGRNSSFGISFPWQSQHLNFNIPNTNPNAQAMLRGIRFAACLCFLHPPFFHTRDPPCLTSLDILVTWCLCLFLSVIEGTFLALGGCYTSHPRSFHLKILRNQCEEKVDTWTACSIFGVSTQLAPGYRNKQDF